jgi:hypothetical protein
MDGIHGVSVGGEDQRDKDTNSLTLEVTASPFETPQAAQGLSCTGQETAPFLLIYKNCFFYYEKKSQKSMQISRVVATTNIEQSAGNVVI